MKLMIDIPEKVVTAIQNGEDYRYDIHTAIAQGIPQEERPQGDLIHREALKHRFAQITYVRFTADMGQGGFEMFSEKEIEDIIDKAPTVPLPDFKEGYKQAIIDGKTNFSRPQGEWIENNYGRIQCSICKGAAISTMTGCLVDRHLEQYKTRFCPWCGADMQKGDSV